MNGMLMVLLLLNLCCACVGAYKASFRILGAICGYCLCCLHLVVLIITPALRFSKRGRLCAYSSAPTNYLGKDVDPIVDDTWTYKKDGALIIALWIIQFLCCCCTCFGATQRGMVPPKNATVG